MAQNESKDYENFRKKIHIATQILEACEWEEKRAEHFNEVLSYSLKTANIKNGMTSNDASEVVAAIAKQFLTEQELEVAKEITSLYFSTNK